MSNSEIIAWVLVTVGGIIAVIRGLMPFMAKSWVQARQNQQQFELSQQGDAFKQSLTITDTLVKFFIETIEKEREQNERLRLSLEKFELDISKKLEMVMQFMANNKTEMSISRLDRVRIEEIVGDIDIELHEIKASISGTTTDSDNKKTIARKVSGQPAGADTE